MDTNSNKFSWFPEAASTFAKDVDYLYIFMNLITAIFTIGICIAIIGFCIKFRRRPGNERPGRIPTSRALELTWTVIPFLFTIVMFFWGAHVFFKQRAIPENATEILVTGKKWMWKFQHPNGRREINDLHIPVGVPIKLKMASEDVIHSMYVPAFRTKQDVLPGRYTFMWFEATKPGVYDLFCNQYCGTDHSRMVGKVYVMETSAYQRWLSGYTGETPEQSGEALFTKYACNTCHVDGSTARGPLLTGVYGSQVLLESGETVTATDDYIRESILSPQAKIVAGFQPLMPGFSGQLNQDQVNDLIAYIKTLKPSDGRATVDHQNAAVPSTEQTTATAVPSSNMQTEGVAQPDANVTDDGAELSGATATPTPAPDTDRSPGTAGEDATTTISQQAAPAASSAANERDNNTPVVTDGDQATTGAQNEGVQ